MRAFVIEHDGDDVRAGVTDVDADAYLVDGDVEVAVEWSCLNFKDAMAVRPRSPVARRSPLIGGVDAAGVVCASTSQLLEVGQRVVAHGHGLGTSHHGGFAPRLRCDGSWLTVLPDRMGPRTAMVFGTAGYTAMASVLALEHAGVAPASGEVLVTGASGGVGSVAVALLAARGFDVTAMTGKPDEHEPLVALGAARVIGRDGLDDRPDRVLGAERFAGAVDCVGGATLGGILRVVRWGGAVAASGLVGGATLETTVYPFITRNVALLGIDSVAAPASVRESVWHELQGALDAATIEVLVAKEVGLQGIAAGLATLERGEARRRILVDPAR
jgi:acrylyl-CoA reductase (NADPH)